MRNFSITNLEQSDRLFSAGLRLSTADYIIESRFIKAHGFMEINEQPFGRVDRLSDLKKVEDNQNYSAAWSLGKLIHLLPNSICSAYDEEGCELDDDGAEFYLVIYKNVVKYIEDGGRCRLSAHGACLLDAVVEIMEKLLREQYFTCPEEEFYD